MSQIFKIVFQTRDIDLRWFRAQELFGSQIQ